MIEAKNLVKKYGDTVALDGVSFAFEKGSVYGFLGPNGAGKSTTMNILTGCLAATEGEVTVNGYDIYADAKMAKSFIGYLPEQPPLYADMTPVEYLLYVGRAKGLRGETLYREVDEVIRRTSLLKVRDRLIKNLSKGYKQRVGIAQAIVGDPEIIILDEPTVGLDPKQIIEIRNLIADLGREHTVILSSHILSEISEVCDYVVIISDGRIVASDTVENLRSVIDGTKIVNLDVKCKSSQAEAVLTQLVDIKHFEVHKKGAGVVSAKVEMSGTADVREQIFFAFAEAKYPIVSMSIEEASLESIFLRITSDSKEKKNKKYKISSVKTEGNNTDLGESEGKE
ncbi:MAG: ABC transporter ATP-binding protein [Clostridia bacterium]|nr:ABC transporter ATP-binding protein [Clostridia bacterium]